MRFYWPKQVFKPFLRRYYVLEDYWVNLLGEGYAIHK